MNGRLLATLGVLGMTGMTGTVGMTGLTGWLCRPALARANRPEPQPQAESDRPDESALRFDESELLKEFTPEVRTGAAPSERALDLWRSEYEDRAEALRRRFRTEADWRPAFADAAVLVADFLDRSDLPRVGARRAGKNEVWIETLDPRTGKRTSRLQQVAPNAPILAPMGDDDLKPGPEKPARVPKRITPPRR